MGTATGKARHTQVHRMATVGTARVGATTAHHNGPQHKAHTTTAHSTRPTTSSTERNPHVSANGTPSTTTLSPRQCQQPRSTSWSPMPLVGPSSTTHHHHHRVGETPTITTVVHHAPTGAHVQAAAAIHSSARSQNHRDHQSCDITTAAHQHRSTPPPQRQCQAQQPRGPAVTDGPSAQGPAVSGVSSTDSHSHAARALPTPKRSGSDPRCHPPPTATPAPMQGWRPTLPMGHQNPGPFTWSHRQAGAPRHPSHRSKANPKCLGSAGWSFISPHPPPNPTQDHTNEGSPKGQPPADPDSRPNTQHTHAPPPRKDQREGQQEGRK